MANLNKVLLIGNLTRDPELRYVPSGTAVATFSMAINRTYQIPSGEKKNDVCFVRVVVWGRRAEVCGEYLNKGSLVYVEGRLQNRTWETPEGQRRTATEVIASNIQFLGRPKSAAAPPAAEAEGEESAPDNAPPQDAGPDKKGDEETPF